MAGNRGLRRVMALVVSVFVVVSGGLAATAPASAQGSATVVWPTGTRFNPDTTSYEIDVAYSGDGYPFVRVDLGWSATLWLDPLDPDGTHEARFPTNLAGAGYLVMIVECPTSTPQTSCPVLSRSPLLQVFRGALSTASENRTPGLGPSESIDLTTYPSDESWDVSWEVVDAADPSSAALVSGHMVDVPSKGQIPALGDQPSLVTGVDYLIRGTVRSDTVDFGHLEGTFVQGFEWDAEAPTFTLVVGHSTGEPDYQIVNDDVFYPVKDDYFDRVIVQAQVTDFEIHDVTLVVTDGEGDEVFRKTEQTSEPFLTWGGRGAEKAVLPEGSYEVTLIARDANDNAHAESRVIELSHAYKRVQTWRRTYRAAPTLVERYVEGCGVLVKPARAAWPGSLGYQVRSPCHKRRTVVATAHGAYVPRSPIDEYGGMRITVNGGKARGETRAELLLYCLNRSGDWVARRELDGMVGRHPGAWLDGHQGILGDQGERPHAIWSVGLSGGWKYDVKSFTVEVEWVDFR